MELNVGISPHQSILLVTLSTILIGSFTYWWQKTKKKPYHKVPTDTVEIPTRWKHVGEVKDLVFYPLKGAKRKCLLKADCTKTGIQEEPQPNKLALFDRVFTLQNDKHEFLSIKKNTKMLFIDTDAIDKKTVKFSFPDSEDLVVKIPDDKASKSYIEIYHGETVQSVDCGDEAAAWFSQRLTNKPNGLRLGCYVQSLVTPRTIKGSYDKQHTKVYPHFHSDYLGTFHNLASYMLMSESSVMDLNSRIVDKRSPVHEHYFRPNIVVKGCPAYDENTWDWIKIGDDVILRGFKDCTRCIITTVDPDTGARDPKIEPLKTLRSYRLLQDPGRKAIDGIDPVMGMYAGCHRTGTIQVGDPVYTNA